MKFLELVKLEQTDDTQIDFHVSDEKFKKTIDQLSKSLHVESKVNYYTKMGTIS